MLIVTIPIIVNAVLICDSRLQNGQNKRKTYQYTVINRHEQQWGEEKIHKYIGSKVPFFPVEKLKSQLLVAIHGLAVSPAPFRHSNTNENNNKWIYTMKNPGEEERNILPVGCSALFLTSSSSTRSATSLNGFWCLCEFIHRYSFALQFNFGFKWENTSTHTLYRSTEAVEHSAFTHFQI